MMQLPLILAINPPSKVQLAQTGNSTFIPRRQPPARRADLNMDAF